MKSNKSVRILLLLISAFYLQAGFAQSDDLTQKNLSSSIARFASSEVQHVEIIEMPPRLMTRARVTQSMLERSYHYSLAIKYIKQGQYGKGFQNAISSIAATPSADPADLRWAIIFLDSEDRRLGAIYFDGTGSSGAVDSTAVSFKGKMFEWLNDNFSATFK